MKCNRCNNTDCELNGSDIEVTEERCQQIDKLRNGEVPEGYVEVEPEFSEDTIYAARETIDAASEDIEDMLKILKRIQESADHTLTAEAGDAIERCCQQIIAPLSEMAGILEDEIKNWDDEEDDDDGVLDTESALAYGIASEFLNDILYKLKQLNDADAVLTEDEMEVITEAQTTLQPILDRVMDTIDAAIDKECEMDADGEDEDIDGGDE